MATIPAPIGGPQVVESTTAPGAAGVYTTERLIASVRRRAFLIPTDDGVTYPTDTNIIDIANEEVVSFLVPWIMEAREGHFLQYVDLPLVGGQQLYPLPVRATASDISVVQLVDSSGQPLFWPGLQQEDMEIAIQFPGQAMNYGTPTRYYFLNNNIALVPAPQGNPNMSLRIYFPQRPSQLIPSTSCVTIATAGQVGNAFNITYSALPTTETFTAGVQYECVHAQPGFEVVALGAPTSVSSTSMSFPGTLPSGVNVGDSLCLQDTANYLTYVPADMLGIFAQWLAVCLLSDKDSPEQLEKATGKLETMTKRMKSFLGKRDQLSHRKISAQSSGRMRRPLFWVR